MSVAKMSNRRRAILGTMFVVAILFVAFSTTVLLSLRSAEKRAQQFCDGIAVGSDASQAISRAVENKILYDSNGGYTFFFPSITGFDKAICGVSIDKNGKVLSKSWRMEID